MKKTLVGSLAAISLLMFLSPAQADNLLHIWNCQLKEGKTGDNVIAASSAWLKAAKSMKGGEKFQVFVDFPLAAPVSEGSFDFVLITEDATSWGIFNDGYPGSVAQKSDDEWAKIASCSGSTLWTSIKVE